MQDISIIYGLMSVRILSLLASKEKKADNKYLRTGVKLKENRDN
jgi:hypothetical protein